MRAVWMITLLSETALTTRSAPTSSMTNAWRVGLSTALTVPRTSTSTKTIQTVTAPVAVSTHSATAGTIISVWVIISRRRLSWRSASTPPSAPSSRTGRN